LFSLFFTIIVQTITITVTKWTLIPCSSFIIYQTSYPYKEKQEVCKDKQAKAVSGEKKTPTLMNITHEYDLFHPPLPPLSLGITGFHRLRPNDHQNMIHALHKTPVAVGIAGTAQSFLMYRGGVYDDITCGDTLNHAALLVGFGTTRQG
jgi:hypothetical protein